MRQCYFVFPEPFHCEDVVPERDHLFPKGAELVGRNVSYCSIPVSEVVL
jgi:hypothetical protein